MIDNNDNSDPKELDLKSFTNNIAKQRGLKIASLNVYSLYSRHIDEIHTMLGNYLFDVFFTFMEMNLKLIQQYLILKLIFPVIILLEKTSTLIAME